MEYHLPRFLLMLLRTSCSPWHPLSCAHVYTKCPIDASAPMWLDSHTSLRSHGLLDMGHQLKMGAKPEDDLVIFPPSTFHFSASYWDLVLMY